MKTFIIHLMMESVEVEKSVIGNKVLAISPGSRQSLSMLDL